MRVEAYFWILLSWLLGFALASLALPDQTKRRLRIALSPPIGMGLVSLLEFLGLSVGWESLAPIAELALVVAISLLLFRQKRVKLADSIATSKPIACPRTLSVALLLFAGMALLSFGLRSYHAPHGESDAMNIWNLHARFLFRSPEHWHDLFAPTLDYSHPDYPLLLPSFIASTWSRLGNDSTLVPILVALAFAASLVTLLYEALRDRGLHLAACLGALCLVASQSFTRFASGQLADIPLATYYLASVVLLTQRGAQECRRGSSLALAGLCVGLAAWTKNEGQLFFLLFMACSIPYLHFSQPGRLWRSFLALLAGAAPALLALLYFKLVLAPGNDLMTTTDAAGILEKIIDVDRYLDVGRGMAVELIRLGDGFLILILAMLILLPRAPQPEDRLARRLSACLAAMAILGYALVYITFSGNVTEHMGTSLPRLMFQIWPLLLFALLTMNPLFPPRKTRDAQA